MFGNSQAILEAVTDALDDLDLHYETDADDGVCFIDFHNGDPLIRSLHVVISVVDEGFIVQADISVKADLNDYELVTALTEFVCRVNLMIIGGAFYVDLNVGTIFFRSFVDCTGLESPSSDMVQRPVMFAVHYWKVIANGLGGILYGELSAEKALELCDFD